MPTSFQIFSDENIALFRMDGNISVRDGRQLFLDYTSHPDFDPTHRMFTDATGVTKIDASFADIIKALMGMPKLLRQFEKGASSVILVGNSTSFGVGRMLESALSATSPIEMTITDDTEEACALTKVTPEFLQQFRMTRQIAN
ncbi:MAG: hypothetical protein JXQ89_15135 [Pelagimonas sp.]